MTLFQLPTEARHISNTLDPSMIPHQPQFQPQHHCSGIHQASSSIVTRQAHTTAAQTTGTNGNYTTSLKTMAAPSSTPRRSTTPIRRTRSVSPARVRDIRKQLQEAKEKPEYVAKVKARANTPRRQAKPASGGAPPPLPARDDTKKLPA